jgi:uncharacterized protein YjbI with pentapeptide repeats
MLDKRTKILGSKGILEYIKANFSKNIGVPQKGFGKKEDRVVRKHFKDFSFQGDFHNVEFRGCKFTNCHFTGIWGFFLEFQNCEFDNCTFLNSRFSHIEENWNCLHFKNSYFRNVEIDEGCTFNLTFEKCTITNFTMLGLNPAENLRFYECTIEDSHFDGVFYYDENETVERDDKFMDFLFEDSLINNTSFYSVNFRNSKFIETVLYKCSFTDCELANDSIINVTKLKYTSYVALDFQTILRSDKIDKKVSKSYFNIEPGIDVKKIVSDMTSPKKFSTVFISYSFKDSVLALKINETLNSRGIKTFLWTKDAPGGKPLNDIMNTGITSHDKLIFIASEHSIKSKACQFELTTARKKQENSWENVFFPITIDNFLFTVQKFQIKPTEVADEYWKNIEEIKHVNALDFSRFNHKKFTNKTFEEYIDKIVEGLKI